MPTVAKWETVSPKGFRIFLEISYDEEEKALSDVSRIEGLLQLNGYTVFTPKWGGRKAEKQIEYVENRTCPKCGKRLIVNQSTNPKAPKIKCEGSKWDFATKKDVGCTFVEWENTQNGTTPVVVRGEITGETVTRTSTMITDNQRAVIEDMQFEGKIPMELELDTLTFQQAKETIRDAIKK